MKRLLASLSNWRLQHVLIVGFALTTAITIAVGSLITNRVINNYLDSAQDARIGRDMDLADAFYNNKLHDITAKETGLGLAIIYGIVKMHRGQINEHSQVGKGTIFTITLPEHSTSQQGPSETGLIVS